MTNRIHDFAEGLSMPKIHIYQRQCQKEKSKPNNLRPAYFSFEKCFVNLLNTLNKDVCELNIIFDGESLGHFINKYKGFNTFNIRAIGQSDSIIQSFKLIKQQIEDGKIKKDDLIYFLEDDYIHYPYWAEYVIDLYRHTNEHHYVSLYDHNDKYIFKQSQGTIEKHGLEPHWGMYKDLKSEIICTGNKHWRTVPSTCDSFILSRDVFLRDYKHHSLGLFDAASFSLISKEFDLTIYSPIVGLSTHAQKPFISPCLNWEDVLDKTINLQQSMQDDRI